MTPRLPRGFSNPVKIGSGGFGSVYRVYQETLNRHVAIKFISQKDPDARSALKKEATLQADLHIRGIPQVYDVFESADQVCIVMQWIKGCSARDLLEQELTGEVRMALAKEIIDICASLHKQGYAHRDLKPENILISAEGVYLIDFGLAHHIRSQRLTAENVIKGTPAYIAPELLKGENHSADQIRADVYSLGKVIQEIFAGDQMPQFLKACLSENPEMRPASAFHIVSAAQIPEFNVNWENICEPLASDLLARQLLRTAKNLMQSRSHAQAYQLLVECLALNPDLHEALDLIREFPKVDVNKKKLQKRIILALTISTIFVLIGSLLVIRSSMRYSADNLVYSGLDSEKSLLLTSNTAPKIESLPPLPFKEETVPAHSIFGQLAIIRHPEKGNLYKNRGLVNTDSNIVFGVFENEQMLYWMNPEKFIVWKEITRVLPFQIKRLKIEER